MVRCESCGVKNPDKATYCSNCGEKLDDNSSEVICESCGVENPAKATYCLNCGSEVISKKSGNSELERSNKIQEIHDWHDLNAVRDNLDGDYILMKDLDKDTAGYEEYNKQTEDYQIEKDAVYEETWTKEAWTVGDTIEIPFDDKDYESVSVEDQDGKAIKHTVGKDKIRIDEDTGQRCIYVTYENAMVGWKPIGAFEGTFNGQGYEIKNLYINRGGCSVGLFEDVKERGKVSDLGVVNVDINGESAVGGLAGINQGTVSNSYATGKVRGKTEIGGLVGFISVRQGGGTVKNSHAKCHVSGSYRVGGLVGVNYHHGEVSNSYAKGTVSGSSCVGGLVGQNGMAIEKSYSTADVSGKSCVGGLVGENIDACEIIFKDETEGLPFTVANSYATGHVSGNSRVGGLMGLNRGGFLENSYFTGKVYFTGEASGDNYVGVIMGNEEVSDRFSNCFSDIETSLQDINDEGIGLTTEKMTGEDAEKNMHGFDFEKIWETVEGSYPILKELSREEQLKD